MTKVEKNGAANIIIACRAAKRAVTENQSSEAVNQMGYAETEAEKLCRYLDRLAKELRKRGESLPISWTEWLREECIP